MRDPLTLKEGVPGAAAGLCGLSVRFSHSARHLPFYKSLSRGHFHWLIFCRPHGIIQ